MSSKILKPFRKIRLVSSDKNTDERSLVSSDIFKLIFKSDDGFKDLLKTTRRTQFTLVK